MLLKNLLKKLERNQKFQVSDFSGSFDDYDGILFGCPAMGDEELEESEFRPFFYRKWRPT